MKKSENPLWWQHGVVYQIYPRSFQDSNDDGIGDLRGIISRIDYLSSLGVDAVWISPIYPSPMADFGYDVSNYTDVHPIFGTIDDFKVLLAEFHKREIKLIIDFVPNHTSDEHPWFIESRSSRTNAKRDWYIWRDGEADGLPPNNWLAMFGGTGWEWDDKTGQYYYHAFLKEQPDLNWRNPEVQNAMLDIIRFWLDLGVDGIRVDVIWHLIKDKQFRDNPINPAYNNLTSTYDKLLPVHSTDQPEVHEILQRMRALLDKYHERVMIGEIYLPVDSLITYYGRANDEVHLPFNFQLINLSWDAIAIERAITEYENSLPESSWPNWVLGNHDQPRIASRVGLKQARVAAVLLLTLRGTPTLYYGDEIGLENVPIPLNEMKDPQGLNMPDKNLSRDPQRTPMQWDASRNSGFSNSIPWLRLAADYRDRNVAAQRADGESILSLYTKLIGLRKSEPALSIGSYRTIFVDKQILVYLREAGDGKKFLVALNFSNSLARFETGMNCHGKIVLSTLSELEGSDIDDRTTLPGDAGIVVELDF